MKYKCIKEYNLTTRKIPQGAIVEAEGNAQNQINVTYKGYLRQMNYTIFKEYFKEEAE